MKFLDFAWLRRCSLRKFNFPKKKDFSLAWKKLKRKVQIFF